MTDLHKLRESIERAASDAVQRHQSALEQSVQAALANSMAELRQSVINQVMAEIEPELATPPGGAPTDLLNAALAAIQDATLQGDILTALLSGAEHFSERCGLLVVRGDRAMGWHARGMDGEAFKQVSVDVRNGLAERAIRTRGPVAGAISEFDHEFVNRFGSSADGNVVLLPLVVGERVPALLYADGGAEGSSGLDASGIEVLVRATDLWLELISARRAAEHGSAGMDSGSFHRELHPEAQGHGTAEAVQTEAPPEVTPAAEEYAAQAESNAVVEAQAEPEVAIPQAADPVADVVATAAVVAGEQAQQSEQATAHVAVAEPELDEVHKKAKRFAKLLVDEIKLYNQAKVAEGRRNRDLYDRLREDIDKSRAAYNKRYAESVSDADYFTNELVRILAENDRGAMGSNF
jgi:hypothetical protein